MNKIVVALVFSFCCIQLALAADTVPTDVQMPGTQPGEIGNLESPGKCDNCHGGYNTAVEPAHNWRGSMMAHAGRDPLFWATLAIAEQDFDGAGDLCLRCHSTSGWLAGRSTPTDGSGLAAGDSDGVECDYCHKLTNPNDAEHLGAMNAPFEANDGGAPAEGFYGSGMGSLWSGSDKLGPYDDADARHQFLPSDFHRDPDFCGTCHDVSNPAVGDLAHNFGALAPSAGITASGQPGSPVDGKAAFNNPPYRYGVVERTFSEHKSSPISTIAVDDFRTSGLPAGGAFEAIYQAASAGESRSADYARPYRQRTYTCQTCHMRPVTGTGANKRGVPVRHDLPLHDMTGGNYWIADAIAWLDGQGLLRLGGGLTADELVAMQDGSLRAKEQLALAATLAVDGNTVTITNHTGHKLITGYPEGRRMWLNVKWYDANQALIREDGAYGPIGVSVTDPVTGVTFEVESIVDLKGTNTRIFQAHMGMTPQWARQLLQLGRSESLALSYDRTTGAIAHTLGDLASELGDEPRETFHFVLNNTVVEDNRIPPFQMDRATALERNAAPVPDTQYLDPNGTYRNYDEFSLNPPADAVAATIDLLYQPTSWEYIQFLWLANSGENSFLGQEGDNMLAAWLHTRMAPPFVMVSTSWGEGGVDTGCDAPVPVLTSASADTNSVTLGWPAITGVTHFNVFYDQSDKSQPISAEPVTCSAPDSCSFTDAGLQQEQSYCYKLTALGETAQGDACLSDFSNVLCASTRPTGQAGTASVVSLITGSIVVSGKGKHKTEDYAPATVFAAGDTIIVRLRVEDAAGSGVPNATAHIEISGPASTSLVSSPSGTDGVAEVSWATEAPSRKGRGGTPTGSYIISVTGLDSQSHEWDAAPAEVTVTIE